METPHVDTRNVVATVKTRTGVSVHVSTPSHVLPRPGAAGTTQTDSRVSVAGYPRVERSDELTRYRP